jgi:hypothetical protein
MSPLHELAEQNADIKEILEDSSISHSQAASRINRMGAGQTSERSVRRYRERREIVLDSLVSPYGSEDHTVAHRPRRDLSVPQWVPGIDIDERGGEFRTRPVTVTLEQTAVEPQEAELLEQFNLDPQVWEITSARKSQWQSGENWLEARRVSFRKRGSGFSLTRDDVEEVMARYSPSSWKGYTRSSEPTGTLVIPAGDLQLGKQDGGGTRATVERFARIINEIAEDYSNEVENLVLPWLGDCIEGSVSQGGRNISNLDVTPAEQVRIYRRLMMHQLAVLAPLGRRVLVPVVPGNHDETTRVQNLGPRDSWAIEGAVAVQDWMSGRPEYAHVSFLFPDSTEPDLTVDIGGVTVAFMHGHGTGKSRPEGIVDWWKGQALGRQLAGEADLLVTAHWHHLRVLSIGGDRTWMQVPALDGGSNWYRQHTGDEPSSGILSFELTPNIPPKWANLKVWT